MGSELNFDLLVCVVFIYFAWYTYENSPLPFVSCDKFWTFAVGLKFSDQSYCFVDAGYLKVLCPW